MISCDGATNTAYVQTSVNYASLNVEVNGVNFTGGESQSLSDELEAAYPDLQCYFADSSQNLYFQNASASVYYRIKVATTDGSQLILSDTSNPTLTLNSDGSVSFCLAPV